MVGSSDSLPDATFAVDEQCVVLMQDMIFGADLQDACVEQAHAEQALALLSKLSRKGHITIGTPCRRFIFPRLHRVVPCQQSPSLRLHGGGMDISDADQAMMAALVQYKLKQYVNFANKCVGTLLMDREGAEAYLRDAVGMKMGH